MPSSVVIPTKNRATSLQISIASVQDQTLPVDEIVIVDDGSTDDTQAILTKLSATDPRIKTVRFDKSVGAAAARNAGIEATTSDWILFLDSDDRWHADKHAKQAARITLMPNAVASFTGYNAVMDDHVRPSPAPVEVSLNHLRGENIISTTSSAMIRRSALQAVGGFDATLPSCQDWDLWLKLRSIGEFAMVDECSMDFILDSNDRISRNPAAVVAGHKIVFSRALMGATGWRARRRIIAQQNLRMSEIYASDVPDPLKRVEHAITAMLVWPGQASRRGFRRAVLGLMNNLTKVSR